MTNHKLQRLVGGILLTVLFSGVAFAQLDPSFKIHLYENGSLVGEVFVPDREKGQLAYTEHWVLYKHYQYPGPRFVGELLVAPIPSMRPYASDADFFRNAPFPEGSKYIEVKAVESDFLPGR